MKAITLTSAGDVDRLLLTELPVPPTGPRDVLIRVAALSINPVDIKTRKGGALFGSMAETPPVILGWDVSGIVEEAGAAVTKFKKGDAVFGMVNFPGHGRAYAEYVAAPEDHLALKPGNISHEAAAATTLAALTAWQVLVDMSKAEAGQHLLVHAAAGGVGHFAVQLAKGLGLRVTGTASAANEDYLKGLGVDQFVNYQEEDVTQVVRDADIVLDPIGGDTTAMSVDCMRMGGTLISIVGGVKDYLGRRISDKSIQAANYLVKSSGRDMETLAQWLQDGRLTPTIEHRFAFEGMADAHRQIETGRTRGKVVVTLGDRAGSDSARR